MAGPPPQSPHAHPTRKAQSSGRASPCRQAGENLGFPHVLNGFSHCGIHEDLRDSEGATLTITRTRAESESESGLDCCLLGVQMVQVCLYIYIYIERERERESERERKRESESASERVSE